ncbi:Uncharacterised protein [Mycobacteroides abscessus subsp. massiliense]|nr:Uncharacterised protein [Mycobacteroides abscessus subsp. massiliense]
MEIGPPPGLALIGDEREGAVRRAGGAPVREDVGPVAQTGHRQHQQPPLRAVVHRAGGVHREQR